MKEIFTGHRTHHHNKLLALLFILVAAALVGYTAIQTKQIAEMFFGTEVNLDQNTVVQDLGSLYFTDAIQRESGQAVTYKYDLNQKKKNVLFDFPYHQSLLPVNTNAAITTLLDVEASSTVSMTDVFRPAYVDLVSAEFNYLDTLPGIAEQHYRLAPDDNAAVAYMQLSSSDDSEPDQTNPDNWEVVIHQPAESQENSTNVVLQGAMYPEWLASGYLSYVSSEGLVEYDLATQESTLMQIPLENFTASNQYVVSLTADELPRALILATGQNEFTVFGASEDGDEIADAQVIYRVSEADTVFTSPVLSPDQTLFAVVALTSVPNSGAESQYTISSEIRVYDFYSAESVVVLPIDLSEVSEPTLLKWQ